MISQTPVGLLGISGDYMGLIDDLLDIAGYCSHQSYNSWCPGCKARIIIKKLKENLYDL